MHEFHNKQTKWYHYLCSVCHELWPTRVVVKTNVNYICTRCKHNKNESKLYSHLDDIHPEDVPTCLQEMTQIEEVLIARTCPIMSVYRKHGGQWGYKGHVLNLPQDIHEFLQTLPCSVADLPILIIHRAGTDNTYFNLMFEGMKFLQLYNGSRQTILATKILQLIIIFYIHYQRMVYPLSL